MKKVIGAGQIIFVSALIFWTMFYNLGKWPYRLWDEGRVITSAYEMLHNHKYFTPTVDNEIDTWSCKPPLMVWAEALSIKAFGFTEWSARLPAALCGMFTILITAAFVRKVTNNNWASVLTVIVLCTSSGLIGTHNARFGEYDGMLALLTTLYLLSFFNYTETTGGTSNRYLIFFFVFLSLACLTKGIAGLLFTPALAVYVLFRRRLLAIFSNKYLYLGVLIFILLVPGYYFLREHFYPGYIQAVWENELGGRFNKVLAGDSQVPATFYISIIRGEQFSTWAWALTFSLFSMWFLGKNKIFRLVLFCWLTSAIFLAVISKSATKLPWYDLPVFPLFAIIVAIVIFQLSDIAGRLPFMNRQIAIVILIVIFSIQPISESYALLSIQSDDLSKDNFYSASYYFREAINGKRNLDGTIYLSCGFTTHWRLYVKRLNDMGVHIEDRSCWGSKQFKAGNRVIANQPEMKDYIEKNYNYNLVDEYYGLKNYFITSAK